MNRFLVYAGRAHLTLLMVFVLAPAGVVVFDSLNSATSFPSPFEGFTLRWYGAMFARQEFLSAALNSAYIAIAAASLGTVLAFLAAYALARSAWRGKNAIATALMAPVFVPEIVLGLTILQIAAVAGLPLDFPTLIGTHAVFVMPFIFRLVMAAFRRFDFSLEDAARSMGAGRMRAIRLVVLPLVRPSLIAGFTLASVMSFINLPISMFLTNPRTATLPVVMFAYMESRIDPMIAAVAALVLGVAVLATLFVDRLLRIRVIG